MMTGLFAAPAIALILLAPMLLSLQTPVSTIGLVVLWAVVMPGLLQAVAATPQ
jgi:hypothetical protein